MTNQVAIPSQVRSILEEKKAEIRATLPQYLDAERFIRIALLAVTKDSKIQECSPESLFLAIMESARIGLMPDGKEAVIIKYGKHAELMPMVGGIINLILRSPGVLKVEARAVYDGDDFGYEYGLHPTLIHQPKNQSDLITHAYAIAWREATEPTFEVMSADEIAQARASSRAPNSPAWTQWYGEMARKVVVKRIAKYLDLSPEASRAIAVDHAIMGDPTMIGSVDGPSDEYRNLLVKNQTEQGLIELKEKIEPKDNGDEPEEEKKKRPLTPAKLKKALNKRSEVIFKEDFDELHQSVIGATIGNLELCFSGDEASTAKRHSVTAYVFGEESFKDLTSPQILALKRWLNATEDSGGAWSPDPMAVKEAKAVVKAQMKKKGQQSLI